MHIRCLRFCDWHMVSSRQEVACITGDYHKEKRFVFREDFEWTLNVFVLLGKKRLCYSAGAGHVKIVRSHVFLELLFAT